MTPKFNIRLATQTDIKCITDLYLSILRETPINILMYSDVSDTDYRKYREEKLSLMIRDGATKVIIAADEETEEILGVLTCFFIGMEKKGFKRDPALPPPTLPPGTNFNRLGKYIAKLREWKQDVLTVFGPHISGDTLHVSQKGRRAGIGTALCKEVAKDAKLFKVPVFFDTTAHSMGFYDSYATTYGLDITYHDHIHHVAGPSALSSYLIQLLPRGNSPKIRLSDTPRLHPIDGEEDDDVGGVTGWVNNERFL